MYQKRVPIIIRENCIALAIDHKCVQLVCNSIQVLAIDGRVSQSSLSLKSMPNTTGLRRLQTNSERDDTYIEFCQRLDHHWNDLSSIICLTHYIVREPICTERAIERERLCCAWALSHRHSEVLCIACKYSTNSRSLPDLAVRCVK